MAMKLSATTAWRWRKRASTAGLRTGGELFFGSWGDLRGAFFCVPSGLEGASELEAGSEAGTVSSPGRSPVPADAVSLSGFFLSGEDDVNLAS